MNDESRIVISSNHRSTFNVHRFLFGYSAVLRYRSPRSGRTTTMSLPALSGRWPLARLHARRAALMAAQDALLAGQSSGHLEGASSSLDHFIDVSRG